MRRAIDSIRRLRRRAERFTVQRAPRITFRFGEDPLPRQLASRVAKAPNIDLPLVLITQIQRSGGTLLTQLFDGHPQVHTYPAELTNLKSMGGAQWFRGLVEERRPERFADRWLFGTGNGFMKQSRGGGVEYEDIFISFEVYKKILNRNESWRRVATPRARADLFFTAFFGSWLDYAGLHDGTKEAVIAFSPRAMSEDRDILAFFEHYPDGRIVFVVRSPWSWYASAKRHSPEYADVEKAVRLWVHQANLFLELRESYPDSIIFLKYEDLVTRPESTLELLMQRIGLDWSDSLLKPTFNGRPILSDSSFAPVKGRIDLGSVDRSNLLSAEEYEKVTDLAAQLLQRLEEVVISPRSPSDAPIG